MDSGVNLADAWRAIRTDAERRRAMNKTRESGAPRTSPTFADEVDRDRRYGEWVAAGGTLRNGMTCFVGSSPRVFFDGQWWLPAMKPSVGAVSTDVR